MNIYLKNTKLVFVSKMLVPTQSMTPIDVNTLKYYAPWRTYGVTFNTNQSVNAPVKVVKISCVMGDAQNDIHIYKLSADHTTTTLVASIDKSNIIVDKEYHDYDVDIQLQAGETLAVGDCACWFDLSGYLHTDAKKYYNCKYNTEGGISQPVSCWDTGASQIPLVGFYYTYLA